MASPLRSLLLLLAVLAVAWAASPKQGMRLVGGVIDANANDTGVLEALNFAMSEYNKENNDAFHSRAIQVVKARKQIVAGVKYFLDVEIGRTTCTKTETALELTKCPFHEQPHLMKKAFCSFQILSVPWLGKQTLTRSSCKKRLRAESSKVMQTAPYLCSFPVVLQPSERLSSSRGHLQYVSTRRSCCRQVLHV